MASLPAGALQPPDYLPNGPLHREREGPVERTSRRQASAAEDADAADILQAWDRARAAEDASQHRPAHYESVSGADSGINAAGNAHEEEGHGLSARKHLMPPVSGDLTRVLLTPARHSHGFSQSARSRLASTDGRKVPSFLDPTDAPPNDRIRKAKQRRNSYSVPEARAVPSESHPGLASTSVRQQEQHAAAEQASGSGRGMRRPPVRRATLQDLQLDLSDLTPAASLQLTSATGVQPTISPVSNIAPGSPPAAAGSSKEQHPTTSTSGQLTRLSPTADSAAEGTGIRKKFIKMISLQKSRTREKAPHPSKLGLQGPTPSEVHEHYHIAEDSDDDDESAGSEGHVAPRPMSHDSDDDDAEDARGGDGPPAAPWKMGGVAGPSPIELRLMGAANSVSFKKSTMKQGVLRPLSTLPPFVPRLFIEDIILNHEKYRGFDTGRDLTAASKTLQPSIIELQAAVMIADVTGFTRLTEILSKKGTSGVELLTTCMNNYFTRAIDMIMAFEGDVIKFAGDSMIVLFYPNEHERRLSDKGLRACTLRMMACSYQLATKLGHMRMKMNGQVEPAPPPTAEPAQSFAAVQAAPSAPLPSAAQAHGMGPLPSLDLDNMEGNQPDMLRNNSGPFNASAAASRRFRQDSPRSSATNQPVQGSATGEEGSPTGTDPAATRVAEGSDQPSSISSRRRGKSWSLMASILKASRANARRSDAYMTPGSLSPAAASSSGPSRVSFEKTESKNPSRMSSRERAKTETGLGLALRNFAGGGGGGGNAAEGSAGGAGAAGLWAGGVGVVQREMSVATKLNLPPPLRPMQPRASMTLSPHGATAGASMTAGTGPLASGVYPGSGSALASLGASTVTPASGSPRSFTENAAGSGSSFRRVHGASLSSCRSERRLPSGFAGQPALAGQSGDWRSKLQNLSTAIVQSPGSGRLEEEVLAPQRSRLSESARAVRWDTVQEEESVAEEASEESGHEEDASYPPIQEPSPTAAANAAKPVLSGAPSGRSAGGFEGASHPSLTSERSYSSVGSVSAGVARTMHAVDLRRKLLLRASHSDREEAHGKRAAAAATDDGLGAGPGPIAEGFEDTPPGRSRQHSDTEGPQHAGGDGKQGSFMQKVVHWFSANARNRNGYVDSFSVVMHQNHQPSTLAMTSPETQSDPQSSLPPSAPPSANNSITAMNNAILNSANAASVMSRPQTIVGSGAPTKAPRGDPIMDEVSNARLSLKVMTSAGSVCVFHVGGGVDEVTDPTLPEVPRWEFFIGDRPLAPLLDANQRRRCVSQVAVIEDQASAGSVVASSEVMELVQGEWELAALPDSVWRVVGPIQSPAQGPFRLSYTSVRTSATSHTPHLRGSDVGAGSSGLQQVTEPHPNTEAAHPCEEEMDVLMLRQTLEGLRLTNSATDGQEGVKAGQPSSGPGVGASRLLGNSLTGSSDRPTNGSGAAAPASQPQPAHYQPQSLLAMGQSDSMERANSLPTSAPSTAAAASAGAATAAATSAAAAAAAAAQLPPRLRHEFVNLPEHVQRRIAGLLRMHVLGSVRVRVEAGHLDFINEIRPLTCMFLGFPSLLQPRDDVAHKDQVQCVQFAYTSVQAIMRKWDGSFLQFRSDEKGFVGICAFGLPGHTHEDNPTRGIRAALELASTIKAGGHTVAIGVTTGDLLCTCVGARKLRSEYTVFGDAINLSARLMVKCKRDSAVGNILCDEPTYLRAKYQASFDELEPLPVKGKAQPVLVYRVNAHDATAEAQAAQERREAAEVSSGERPLIGRDPEMTLTLNHAASMISGMSQGGIIIIEGNTGMGKTKLLMEVRKSLERINADTSIGSRPAFHMVFGMADTANKSQKLHPWRRVFQELFALDLKLKNMAAAGPGGTNTSSSGTTPSGPTGRRTAPNASTSGAVAGLGQGRRRGTEDGPGHAVFTALGERLSKVPNYDTEWRQHLAELLDLPLPSIPLGSLEAEQAQLAPQPQPPQPTLSQAGQAVGSDQVDGDGPEGAGLPPPLGATQSVPVGLFPLSGDALEMLPASLAAATPGSMLRSSSPWKTPSMRHASMTMPVPPPGLLDPHMHPGGLATAGSVVPGAVAGKVSSPVHATPHTSQVGADIRKNSLNFLVHVMQEFISLYGPTLALLENLHDFDTWSWQLLVKAAELLTSDCMILATTRPNDLPAVGASHHLHGKAAMYQKVAMMYRHLLKLPSATRIVLEPFTFHQTKSLMQVVADINYPDQYVLAVMEKTGGMPLYIEKVTEFLCQSQPMTQRPWLPDQGGEFSANVNKMIRNLNFQQVIIERMDRLKPGIHLTLKVASVMGQWVDLEILHKFYPINKSKEELKAHLQELERGNFLKPTDTEGVWEFNMVERDIVYEVIPHYQRRRLHAKLAQELEKSLEEQHVATLTTIAYHWHQACMGHEVAEVECSLKAIEFWHRAAEAAYNGSSLMEALKLYQKAAQIAEILAESMGGSVTAGNHQALSKGRDRPVDDAGPSTSGGGAQEGGSADGRIDGTDQSFTAVGSAFKGQLNWGLISRLSRSQWETKMASCCLGIVMQQCYEYNHSEYWDTEDYFRLLTEHAIRGLMLLGAPHPKALLSEKRSANGNGTLLTRLCGCCFQGGSSSVVGSGGSQSAGPQHGWHTGLVLQDGEVQEIREILLVLIVAANHYSLHHDWNEYVRLLTFCKRVCKFFNKCSDSGTDPFLDIRDACSRCIKKLQNQSRTADREWRHSVQ
ncbi:hypothetical protein Agub_g9980 [Astrephomene gubernaculifera]|uniref:Guanylate cyclase domain-containing protein n=1 Tax=Astrephomene gubernaculifera TaxID=47775 RepID=A0AAD3DUL6_9CHLO|nr:hypothetical protein Agub_g9980 [Astrephomene gubernaculifera]